ncbi:DUF1670 domain-containing protein [Methanosarcina sp. 1.H.T.1A.1]|uniref:DUF1670 domain-containing protein n=1 Tax=Methanosarcina sp. 1.H.T.1A.1 TaxID=1483602 RepID=UPI00064F04FB|nr:DUF1670 domain-containing protein [Methanosarcina sp. 1.H.T.1A.1]
MTLYFSSQRKEGQIIFHAVSKDIPPGIPVDEMNLVPIKITIYGSDDCTVKDQQELLDKRIKRISSETYAQGALITQADIAILLEESTKTISQHITSLEKKGELVPTRGKMEGHRSWDKPQEKKILELYLKGYEYTEIKRKTKHSCESIMRYGKDFERIPILTEDGFDDEYLRIITGISEKTIREYKELIKPILLRNSKSV